MEKGTGLARRKMSKTQMISTVIILGCLAALIIYLFASGDAAQIPSALAWPSSMWLLVGLASIIAGWLFEAFVLYEMARGFSDPIPYRAAIRSTMVVQFFNNVTPSSTGGQPMQVWSLWRDGVPVGEAGSVLLGKFAVYQGALVTCGIAAIVYAHGLFASQVGGWMWLFIIAFIAQAAICAVLMAIIIKPGAVRWIVDKVFALLSRTRARNWVDRNTERVSNALSRFEQSSHDLVGHPKVFLKTYLLTLIQLQSVLIVPYCICRSLGVQASIPVVLSAAAFVLMVSGVFPTPGASGGAEGSFLLLFGLLFPEGVSVSVGILLWRLLTFYFPVIAGSFFCTGAPTPQLAAAQNEQHRLEE
jgi:uncharacterized protein (TIRG00374 family)